MTPEQIEQWAREADEYARQQLRAQAGTITEWSIRETARQLAYHTHFARLARADAFESSAMVADELAQAYGGVRESPIHTEFGRALSEAKAVGAHNAAVSIRALAEREKEPSNGS